MTQYNATIIMAVTIKGTSHDEVYEELCSL